MRIRIETFDEWAKLIVDGKCVAAGHTTGYLWSALLDTLRQQGAEVEEVYWDGYAKDPDGDAYQTEPCSKGWWEEDDDDVCED